MIFAATAVAVFVLEYWGERLKTPRWAPVAAYAVAMVPALLAVATMVAAGHSGAQLVWRDVGTFTVAR